MYMTVLTRLIMTAHASNSRKPSSQTISIKLRPLLLGSAKNADPVRPDSKNSNQLLLHGRSTKMDTPTNEFAQIAAATAWPIVTLVVALLYRTDIRSLLGRFKKGKIGDAEFEFHEAVKELANDMAEVLPAAGVVALKPDAVSLVTKNPQAALLNAWTDIRSALTDLARKHDLLNEQTSRSYSALVRALADVGLIPRSYALGFLALLQLYNQSARQIDFKPSEEAVLGYLKVAEKLKQLLLEAERPTKPVAPDMGSDSNPPQLSV